MRASNRASRRQLIAAFGALLLGACAARAPSLPANHPADPAAPTGRLAGPPAILRAARPATTPSPTPAPAPGHDHGAH